MGPAMKVSIVIPTLNEAVELPETLRRLRALPGLHETIVADGGSTDATREIATQAGARLIETMPGRGHQLRAGAAAASGEVIVFLHADTWVPDHLVEALHQALANPRVVGGGFWKVFRHPTLLMRGSRTRCWFRLKLGGLVLGDQGFFVRRDVLERIGGVPEMVLMEEFELCRRLRREGRLVLAPATVVTSERRFRKLGVLRTYARMWRVSLGYRCGQPLDELKRIYEAP
jgi:rSAM/selenodomain-associated transferase 2